MARFDLYGLGNALVDTEYHISDELLVGLGVEKGMMTLIDDAQLALLEEQLRSRGELKKQASGGSAANSLIAAANFGSKVFYSCKVADDELGAFYHQDLVDSGVATNLDQIREPGTTGRCLVMVTDDAERTMNTFLGITGDLGAHEIDATALKASSMLYIEGYLASSDKAREAAIRAHQIAKDAGIQVALTFSDPAMVTYFKDQVSEMVGDGVDLLFCNEQEAMTWTGEESIEGALTALSNTATQWVCTRGKDGATVFDGEKRFDIPGRVVTPIDTNGAGDMFAGAFLHGLSNDWGFEKSAYFGVYTSSYLITQYGPRVAPASHRILLEEFEAAY
ncbi:MAG: adenosine kinase [Pseudomonadota bacterium]|nr:adenosine kinase [Pseudomonadota bacterium]MEE2820203.1 adenosine kinase [Pseudomonadota bacterium]